MTQAFSSTTETQTGLGQRGQKGGCVASLCSSWMLKFCLWMCDIHVFPAYIAPPSGQHGQQHTEDMLWIAYYYTIWLFVVYSLLKSDLVTLQLLVGKGSLLLEKPQ